MRVTPATVRAILVLGVAAAVGVAAGALTFRERTVEVNTGTLLPTPREIPEFALTGDDNQPFTREDLKDRWTVIFTGFTHCPDVCPTTLATLKNVAGRLGDSQDRLQVLFVSVDPERDTPEKLRSYVQYFSPKFRGATGPNAELDRLGKSLGFVYLKNPGATPDSYTMDHSTALILVNPRAQLAGYFTPPLSAEALAADLGALLESRT